MGIGLPLLMALGTAGYAKGKVKYDTGIQKITHKGYTITLSEPYDDTIITKHQVTGEPLMRIVTVEPFPKLLNGMPIVDRKLAEPPFFKSMYENPRMMLVSMLKEDLAKLENGLYLLNISNVVIDTGGSIASYWYGGIHQCKPVDDSTPSTVTPKYQQKMYGKVADLMKKAPAYLPVKVEGKKINALINPSEFWKQFKVEAHQVFEMDNFGRWNLAQ